MIINAGDIVVNISDDLLLNEEFSLDEILQYEIGQAAQRYMRAVVKAEEQKLLFGNGDDQPVGILEA